MLNKISKYSITGKASLHIRIATNEDKHSKAYFVPFAKEKNMIIRFIT